MTSDKTLTNDSLEFGGNVDPPTNLHEATFKFSQEGNCLGSTEEYETLNITYESSLGIDTDKGRYFVLRTDGWSVDDERDLEKLFNRIKKILNET